MTKKNDRETRWVNNNLEGQAYLNFFKFSLSISLRNMGCLNLNQRVFDISVTIWVQCIISQLITPIPVEKGPTQSYPPRDRTLTPKRQPDALPHRPRETDRQAHFRECYARTNDRYSNEGIHYALRCFHLQNYYTAVL